MRIHRRAAFHALALSLMLAAAAALAQSSAVDEIAKYRAALQDGNPAELWEARGADLWKQKRGPKNASLEQCDLGLGPGVVKGAYAQLPRYFPDADRVMDLETRIVWCMVKLQGFPEADAVKPCPRPLPGSGQDHKHRPACCRISC
jgi:sulfur-oxidizing protein SoxA